MIRKVGPFTFYRLKRLKSLDIYLTKFGNLPFGWECGWEDELASRKPWIELRVGRLIVFSFEKWKKGFEIRLLGFWWIK